MEEKKLDLNSNIGFLLIFGILLFWFYLNQPTPEELEAEQQATEQVQQLEAEEPATPQPLTPVEEPVAYSNDSLAQQAYARGESPAELRRKVTSPRGTTEAAVHVFLERDFGGTIFSGIKRARDRSIELSQEVEGNN